MTEKKTVLAWLPRDCSSLPYTNASCLDSSPIWRRLFGFSDYDTSWSSVAVCWNSIVGSSNDVENVGVEEALSPGRPEVEEVSWPSRRCFRRSRRPTSFSDCGTCENLMLNYASFFLSHYIFCVFAYLSKKAYHIYVYFTFIDVCQ